MLPHRDRLDAARPRRSGSIGRTLPRRLRRMGAARYGASGVSMFRPAVTREQHEVCRRPDLHQQRFGPSMIGDSTDWNRAAGVIGWPGVVDKPILVQAGR